MLQIIGGDEQSVAPWELRMRSCAVATAADNKPPRTMAASISTVAAAASYDRTKRSKDWERLTLNREKKKNDLQTLQGGLCLAREHKLNEWASEEKAKVLETARKHSRLDVFACGLAYIRLSCRGF